MRFYHPFLSLLQNSLSCYKVKLIEQPYIKSSSNVKTGSSKYISTVGSLINGDMGVL